MWHHRSTMNSLLRVAWWAWHKKGNRLTVSAYRHLVAFFPPSLVNAAPPEEGYAGLSWAGREGDFFSCPSIAHSNGTVLICQIKMSWCYLGMLNQTKQLTHCTGDSSDWVSRAVFDSHTTAVIELGVSAHTTMSSSSSSSSSWEKVTRKHDTSQLRLSVIPYLELS